LTTTFAAAATMPAREQTTAKKQATEFIKSIMADFEEVSFSYNMSVLRNVFQLETGTEVDVVIHLTTENFWQECVHQFKDYTKINRVRVVGTRGIGKTIATSILIRKLLVEGHTVVFLIRTVNKTGWYYEFSLRAPTRKIAINVFPEKLHHDEIASLRNTSTYYVVDPGNTEDSCDPDCDFKARVILISSPDARHWGESPFTNRYKGAVQGTFKYFPLWTYWELLAARPIIGPALTDDETIHRYGEVGGVPRHVFANNSDYAMALAVQQQAVDRLTEKYAYFILDGMFDPLKYRVIKDDQRSPLVGYTEAGRNHNGRFSQYKVVLVSSTVERQVYTKFSYIFWPAMLTEKLKPAIG
jgi:hypothetical protein